MNLQLFHHTISFKKADPLGGGLGEEIAAERLEPEAITLDDGVIDGELEARWQELQNEIKQDPDWITFSEE